MENKFKRTVKCGEINEKHIGNQVVLNGWIQKRRNLGGLIFADLRDISGIVQIVFDTDFQDEAFRAASELRSEYVVGVTGKVMEREAKNDSIKTGSVEVYVNSLKIFSKAETPPIYIKDDDDISEEMKLKYRFLDLRKHSMQQNLVTRALTSKVVRDFMFENGFHEIETPVLNKPTPEGARDYLVPSRTNKGKFYALPQSPQIFKQLLMVSGMDRYYQIVKCFRDEDLRANRQPEFTQIDIEMSFIDMEDIIEINEKLMQTIFRKVKGIEIDIPFRRMTYEEAVNKYGSDKPDLRFGYGFTDITEVFSDSGFNAFKNNTAEGRSVKAINFKGYADSFSKKNISNLEKHVKTYRANGLAWIKRTDGVSECPVYKFLSDNEIYMLEEKLNLEDGDIVFIIADETDTVNTALGELRKKAAEHAGVEYDEKYSFCWIVEFPLFEYDEEESRYVAKHHPFTSPHPEDIHLLHTDPGKARANAYDLVVNGEELGGGSIRITDEKMQRKLFEIIGLTECEAEEKFGFLINAFKYGVPPHGGIAFGLDRMIMLLTENENIRDVIAFPKTQSATCLLSGAPTHVQEKQLEELGIRLLDK